METTASAITPRQGALHAFWEFARPHTIIGTTLAAVVLYVLAVAATGEQDLSLLFLSYLAGLGVNIYVVGINQITDVDIDRINKPYLPLASGAFDMPTALSIVCISLAASIALAASQGPYLFYTVLIVFALGTAYSLPPFRFKEKPLWAAASITLARAVVGNLGGYLHYTHQLAGQPSMPVDVLAFVAFMFVFVTVIAIMKDVPDIEGDKACEVPTLARRLGVEKTLRLCRLILTISSLAFGVVALFFSSVLAAACVWAAHALGLALLWGRARRVDVRSSDSVYRYYMLLWKLYYLEFLTFPVAVTLDRLG